MNLLLTLLLAFCIVSPLSAEPETTELTDSASQVETNNGKYSVYVVPIHGGIGGSVEFVIRRAAKEAQASGVDAILLDIDTPGGSLGNTLEIMKILDRFEGDTFAYVNPEAMSAGAYISISTDEIYFAPDGIIGAAEAVSSGGEDISESMKRKINSYMRAKIRLYSEGEPYRATVMRAMMDDGYELEIEGVKLKEKDELLSLTANEAMKKYGEPAKPLFGSGIYESVEDLLDNRYGKDNYEIREFKITWSEEIAKYVEMASPILMSIGLLLIFIEFKTPGFGIIGISGVCLILFVFVSNNIAGMAGNEPILLFIIGILLITVELLVLPGTVLPAIIGIILVFVSMIWSLADIWPLPTNEDGTPGGWDINYQVFKGPLMEVLLSILMTMGMFAIIYKYLPKTWIWSQLVLETPSAKNTFSPIAAGGGVEAQSNAHLPDIDIQGKAVTDLHPGGEIEVEGKRYQASASLGYITKGSLIRVVEKKDFSLIVEEIDQKDIK